MGKEGPEEIIRVIHRLNDEVVGKTGEVKTLVFDECFIAEGYALTGRRSEKGESRYLVFDLEMHRHGSLSYHQRTNVNASGPFRDSLKKGEEYKNALLTRVISFIMMPHSAPSDNLMYLTKPKTTVLESDSSRLIDLVIFFGMKGLSWLKLLWNQQRQSSSNLMQ